MDTIIKVMQSLIKLNGWTLERFDLRLNTLGDKEYYAAYLTVKELSSDIVIREGGSFDLVD